MYTQKYQTEKEYIANTLSAIKSKLHQAYGDSKDIKKLLSKKGVKADLRSLDGWRKAAYVIWAEIGNTDNPGRHFASHVIQALVSQKIYA